LRCETQSLKTFDSPLLMYLIILLLLLNKWWYNNNTRTNQLQESKKDAIVAISCD